MSSNIFCNISSAKIGETVENDYDGEIWTKIETAMEVPKNISKIWCAGTVETKDVEYGDVYYIATFHGGLNGRKLKNKWQTYLADISRVMALYDDAWLISLENDCLDDVFYFTIGYNG